MPAAGFTQVRAALHDYAVDPATGAYRLDVFREPHDGEVWICRRDWRIRRPSREVVLLVKAKRNRPKDREDLQRVPPLLGATRLAWLVEALSSVHPGHAWTRVLRSAP